MRECVGPWASCALAAIPRECGEPLGRCSSWLKQASQPAASQHSGCMQGGERRECTAPCLCVRTCIRACAQISRARALLKSPHPPLCTPRSTCAIGGAIACGGTHTAVTPLDVVKCNMQVDPKKYGGIVNGFSVVAREQGMAGIIRGWFPTLMGYSAQGAFKFGLYEYFKK